MDEPTNSSNSKVAPDWFPDATGPPTILVVEDEPMIGIDLVNMISERCGTTVGPVESIEAAKSAIANVHIDGAILDLDLKGEMSIDIANLMKAAHIPFVIYTGLDPSLMPPRLRNIPCLQKPSTSADVVDRLFATMHG